MAALRHKTRSERTLDGGKEIEFSFREDEKPPIPAILQLPARPEAVPAVLLLHGFSSRKEVLSESLGRALLPKGIGSLAIDLPLHGARRDPGATAAFQNPLKAVAQWRLAISEAHSALRYLRARKEIASDRIAVIGYSLGSHVAAAVCAADPEVQALVVAAGGDLPEGSAMSALARTVADPLAAIRKLQGRPLLMVHGSSDRTVRPAQAQRLFEAAAEPKELRWYPSGHRLPNEAVSDVVEWLLAHLG